MNTVKPNSRPRLPPASELVKSKSSLLNAQISPVFTATKSAASKLPEPQIPEIYDSIDTPVSTPTSDRPALPPLNNFASSPQVQEPASNSGSPQISKHTESNTTFEIPSQPAVAVITNDPYIPTPNYRWGTTNGALRSPENSNINSRVTPVTAPHGNRNTNGVNSRHLSPPPPFLMTKNNSNNNNTSTLPSFKSINHAVSKLPPLMSSLSTSPSLGNSRELPPPPLLATGSSPRQQPVVSMTVEPSVERQHSPGQAQHQHVQISRSGLQHPQQTYPYPQYQEPPNVYNHPQYQPYPPGHPIGPNQVSSNHPEITHRPLPINGGTHPYYPHHQHRQPMPPPHSHSGIYASQLPPNEQYSPPPTGSYQPPYYQHQNFHSQQGPFPMPYPIHGPPLNMVHSAGFSPMVGNPQMPGPHQFAMPANQQHPAQGPPQPLAGSMYPPPPGLQQAHLYYSDYQMRGAEMGGVHGNHQLIDIASSREIKRRTKTGCLTCRKRRIKCDERHPTCYNCDKSKRVCLGYDPVFKVTSDRRTRKAGNEQITAESSDVSMISIKQEKLVPVNISVDHTNFNAASRSPSTGTVNTTPPIQHSPESSPGSAGPRNKMTINSLLDAAAAIDMKGSTSSGKRKVEATGAYTKQDPKKIRSFGGFEDEKCSSWDLVEKNFHIHIAKFLDDIFATSRFGGMQILGLAHSCGLPMDGNGTVVIPANSGGTTVRSDPSYNSTFTIGQQIATLEAIRQMLLVLCPKFNLDNLSIDEGSVGKLEELRIGNDYRLLRAIFQLITADNTTLFLPVSEKDEHFLARIQSLYQFVTKRDVDINLEDPDVRKDPANRPVVGNVRDCTAKLFSQSLADHSNEQIWELLTLIATMTENIIEDELQLNAEQETQFLQFVKSSRSHQLHIPLVLGGHFYLSMRRPVLQDFIGLQDYFKQQLIESSTSLNSNVVTRKLISMVLD